VAKTEKELRDEFERYSDRENWSAWLIVVALLMEAYAAWYFSTPDKEWYETTFLIAANLAIAAGVYGEIRFGRKADTVGEALQQISDERIAASEARAAEAQLETEKLKAQFAWRFLPLEKVAELANKLRATPASVQISYLQSDPECLYFAKQWWAIFRMARWPVQMQGSTSGELWFGIILEGGAGSNETPASQEATALVMKALSEAGIGFNVAPIPRWVTGLHFPSKEPMGEKIAQMCIGPRQPTIG
jgi:hypothetical protein